MPGLSASDQKGFNLAVKAGGFTLIEILVAISIIGVLSLFIIPAFRRYNDEQTLRNAAADFVQTIRQAQINSQSRVKCQDGNPPWSWAVNINTDTTANSSSYQLTAECQDQQHNYVIIDDLTSFATKSLPTNISIAMQDDTSPTQRFSVPKFITPDCPFSTGSFPFAIRYYTSLNSATFTRKIDQTNQPYTCPASLGQSQRLEFYLTSRNIDLVAKISVDRGGSIGVEFH